MYPSNSNSLYAAITVFLATLRALAKFLEDGRGSLGPINPLVIASINC